MAINTIVKDPEMIRDLSELDDILSRIIAFEEERKCYAGVLLIQRRGINGVYRIKSRDDAIQDMTKSILDDGKGNKTSEWGIKFYPRYYFEELRDKLNGEKQESYS